MAEFTAGGVALALQVQLVARRWIEVAKDLTYVSIVFVVEMKTGLAVAARSKAQCFIADDHLGVR